MQRVLCAVSYYHTLSLTLLEKCVSLSSSALVDCLIPSGNIKIQTNRQTNERTNKHKRVFLKIKEGKKNPGRRNKKKNKNKEKERGKKRSRRDSFSRGVFSEMDNDAWAKGNGKSAKGSRKNPSVYTSHPRVYFSLVSLSPLKWNISEAIVPLKKRKTNAEKKLYNNFNFCCPFSGLLFFIYLFIFLNWKRINKV